MAPSADPAPVHTLSPSDVAFPGIPPFPKDVPTAPLLRIQLKKLLEGDKEEEERCWRACCELGFFYVDLRTGSKTKRGEKDSRGTDLANGQEHGIEHRNMDQNNGSMGKVEDDAMVDGEALLADADRLFRVEEEFFQLPVEEKVKYDFADQGSYFGYKGYGAGIIDKEGNTDRNEFYNISKTGLLSLTPPLPAPALL
ncbi:hypothetical protein AOQ84DRAFT_19441, partial [Glonium stellatum]